MHYNVAVITDYQPDESDITDIMARYSFDLDADKEITRTKEEILEDISCIEEMSEEMKKLLAEGKKEELIRQWYDEGYCEYELDEDYNEFYWCNYDGQWDWWVIGGRWDGYFNGKNQGQIKELKRIDRNKNIKELRKSYPKEYRKFIKRREEIRKLEEGSYVRNEFEQYYPSFKEYIYSEKETYTYAIVDEEGEWLGNEYSREEWDKIIFGKDKDYWITIVDCHC